MTLLWTTWKDWCVILFVTLSIFICHALKLKSTCLLFWFSRSWYRWGSWWRSRRGSRGGAWRFHISCRPITVQTSKRLFNLQPCPLPVQQELPSTSVYKLLILFRFTSQHLTSSDYCQSAANYNSEVVSYVLIINLLHSAIYVKDQGWSIKNIRKCKTTHRWLVVQKGHHA